MARFAPDAVFHISPQTFNEIEDYIRACENSGRNLRLGMDALVMLMARTHQAIAQEKSRGPVDPQETNPAAAWRIPVRRITSRYYKGWRVRRVAPGVYVSYNNSREAYFIEYGINHVGAGTTVSSRSGPSYIKGGNRVRRPINKLALIATVRAMDSTRAGHRVWEVIFSPFRDPRGRNWRGGGFTVDRVQSLSGMRYL